MKLPSFLCAILSFAGVGRAAPPDPLQQAARLEERAGRVNTDLRLAEQLLLRALSLRQDRLGATDGGLTQTLGVLARVYSRQGRWDEHSVVRGRMLEIWQRSRPPSQRPERPPGGPFPRIGAPGPRPPGPGTILGRWLNRQTLPELYAAKQVEPRELEQRLASEVATGGAPTLERLGDLLAASTFFSQAAQRYREALAATTRAAALDRRRCQRSLTAVLELTQPR